MSGGWRARGLGGLGPVAAVAGAGVALAAVFASAQRARGMPLSLSAYHELREAAISAVTAVFPARAVGFPVGQWLGHAFLSPPFFFATAAILLAEWAWPVNPEQPLLSPSFVHDLVWYLATIGGFVLVGGWLYEHLRGLYQAHLRSLGIGVLPAGPAWLSVLAGIVVGDLFAWLHHLVRHKVRLFWLFHEVHHAQRNLNAWTNERVHVVDVLIAVSIQTLPLLALGVPTTTAGAYVVAAAWYTRLCHANVRSHFGFLRHVLVTPQSHRLHHSARPEHADQNFGVIFSVWDRMFGTLSRDVDVYPETGLTDPTFPVERGYGDVVCLRAFLRQQIHPFRAMVALLRKRT